MVGEYGSLSVISSSEIAQNDNTWSLFSSLTLYNKILCFNDPEVKRLPKTLWEKKKTLVNQHYLVF